MNGSTVLTAYSLLDRSQFTPSAIGGSPLSHNGQITHFLSPCTFCKVLVHVYIHTHPDSSPAPRISWLCSSQGYYIPPTPGSDPVTCFHFSGWLHNNFAKLHMHGELVKSTMAKFQLAQKNSVGVAWAPVVCRPTVSSIGLFSVVLIGGRALLSLRTRNVHCITSPKRRSSFLFFKKRYM